MPAQEAARPKIGLALSGGGAKGLAHVGVLKVLEANGIRPDYITGTSMGALVGALYAIGYSVEQLEEMALSIEWQQYFSDRVPQNYRPIEDKLSPAQYQLSFPLYEGKPELPKGLLGGANFRLLLTRLCLPVHGTRRFADFPIPFRCVATDLETGKAVVFSRGDLIDALRATASIPTVFEPAELQGKMLVDGGVVRNFPVSDARDMGADFVIGIDVGAPLHDQEGLNSLINILDQTSSFRIVESSREQREAADFVIRPGIEEFSAMAFEEPELLLSLGEIAANSSINRLLSQLNDIGYASPAHLSKQPQLVLPEKILVRKLTFVGDKEATRLTLEQLVRLPEGKAIGLDQIEDQVRLLYAAEYFKQVDYRLFAQTDSAYRLELRAIGAREGAVKIGINYEGNLKAGLLLNYSRRNLGIAGSLFSTDLKISENPILRLHYRWQTPQKPNLGLRAQFLFNTYPAFLYTGRQRSEIFSMNFTQTQVAVYSGLNRNWLLGLGLGLENRLERSSLVDFSSELTWQYLPYVSLELRANTLDQQVFPAEGFRLDFNALYSLLGRIRTRDLAGNRQDQDQVEHSRASLAYQHVIPFSDRINLQSLLHAGFSRSTDPYFLNLFFIGRPLPYLNQYVPFVGFRHMERPASAFAFGGLRLQGEVFEQAYLSLVYNQGYFWQTPYSRFAEAETLVQEADQGVMAGLGLELGYLSSGGPIQYSLEYNAFTQKWSMALSLGYVF
jgi:NTE family protein